MSVHYQHDDDNLQTCRKIEQMITSNSIDFDHHHHHHQQQQQQQEQIKRLTADKRTFDHRLAALCRQLKSMIGELESLSQINDQLFAACIAQIYAVSQPKNLSSNDPDQESESETESGEQEFVEAEEEEEEEEEVGGGEPKSIEPVSSNNNNNNNNSDHHLPKMVQSTIGSSPYDHCGDDNFRRNKFSLDLDRICAPQVDQLSEAQINDLINLLYEAVVSSGGDEPSHHHRQQRDFLERFERLYQSEVRCEQNQSTAIERENEEEEEDENEEDEGKEKEKEEEEDVAISDRTSVVETYFSVEDEFADETNVNCDDDYISNHLNCGQEFFGSNSHDVTIYEMCLDTMPNDNHDEDEDDEDNQEEKKEIKKKVSFSSSSSSSSDSAVQPETNVTDDESDRSIYDDPLSDFDNSPIRKMDRITLEISDQNNEDICSSLAADIDVIIPSNHSFDDDDDEDEVTAAAAIIEQETSDKLVDSFLMLSPHSDNSSSAVSSASVSPLSMQNSKEDLVDLMHDDDDDDHDGDENEMDDGNDQNHEKHQISKSDLSKNRSSSISSSSSTSSSSYPSPSSTSSFSSSPSSSSSSSSSSNLSSSPAKNTQNIPDDDSSQNDSAARFDDATTQNEQQDGQDEQDEEKEQPQIVRKTVHIKGYDKTGNETFERVVLRPVGIRRAETFNAGSRLNRPKAESWLNTLLVRKKKNNGGLSGVDADHGADRAPNDNNGDADDANGEEEDAAAAAAAEETSSFANRRNMWERRTLGRGYKFR